MEEPKKTIQFDLNDLLEEYQEEDTETLTMYLLKIFDDLAQRSKDPNKGIDRLTFDKFYELPGILSERFFSVLDKNHDNYLNYAEFVSGLSLLFTKGKPFKSLAKLIFNFYNFNRTGKITKEDIKIVLSHIPLQNLSSSKNKFKERIESQEQIDTILQNTFDDKTELDLQQFMDIVENKNSDIFIHLLSYLLEKKPINKESKQIFEANHLTPNQAPSSTIEMIRTKIASPSINTKFISPKLKTSIINRNKMNKNQNNHLNYLNIFTNKNDTKTESKFAKVKSSDDLNKLLKEKPKENLDKKIKSEDKNEEESSNDHNTNKNIPQRRINVFHLEDAKVDPKKHESCINIKIDDDDLKKDYVENCIKHEGYIFKLNQNNRMKKLFFKLVGRDLYYYKKKEDAKYAGMHNLSDIYAKRIEDFIFQEKKYFTIEITFPPNKNRVYYFDNENECQTWLEKFRLVGEHRYIFDEYTISKQISKGKFGLVKYGINKSKKESVAIKILSKKNMDDFNLELARTEIKILKICQHPYIIKLFDVFESQEYIYIVTEYCEGGDLLSYIKKNNYKLAEEKACEIIHKLSLAIYFIQSIGVVHRDIKPANIMLTDMTLEADIRLADFGLGKILGPGEKCYGLFGTLPFIAPEILNDQPYDKACDLWSLGVITYLLLCGSLPFDDSKTEQEIIQKTINDEIPFSAPIWENLSSQSKAFVGGLLKKNPQERLNINQVLDHTWIKKFSTVADLRKTDNI